MKYVLILNIETKQEQELTQEQLYEMRQHFHSRLEGYYNDPLPFLKGSIITFGYVTTTPTLTDSKVNLIGELHLDD